MKVRKRLFEGLTVAVVGAGSGLGRQYCIDLAASGAKVIVAGRGGNVSTVASEITAAGGVAVACICDVREGWRVVEAALDHFGCLDGLIVNAGVVRDSSFGNMSQADWDEVVSVHLQGSFSCAKAAWTPMTAQKGGRIVLTTSAAALHGNFGQANYAAAKGAILGLTRTLAIEGEPRNIKVNALSPIAYTGMTSGILGAETETILTPAKVSPVALALVHPRFNESGSMVETGGGWVAALRWQRSAGLRFDSLSAAELLDDWDRVGDFGSGSDFPSTISESLKSAVADADVKQLFARPERYSKPG